MNDLLFIAEIAAVSLFGLILGSFATALAWRVPRGISWIKNTSDKDNAPAEGVYARSACPACQSQLKSLDLIPVLSWCFLRGRCRYCRNPIGWRYLFIELGALCAILGVYACWGLSVESVLLMCTVPFLAALFVIDMDFMILPNQLVLIIGGLGAAFVLAGLAGADFNINRDAVLINRVGGGVAYAFMAWVTGFIMTRVLGKDALGFGDVKFFAVAGLWLGLGYLSFFLIFSGAVGIIWGGYSLAVLKKRHFPFGPALITSFYIGMLLQGQGWDPLGLIP